VSNIYILLVTTGDALKNNTRFGIKAIKRGPGRGLKALHYEFDVDSLRMRRSDDSAYVLCHVARRL